MKTICRFIQTTVCTAQLLASIVDAAGDFPTVRNPYTWPFVQSSIWNMPVGSDAIYVDASIEAAGSAGMTVDEDIIILTPSEPLVDVFRTDHTWGTEVRNDPSLRCVKADNTVLYSLPIPAAFVQQRDGLTPNNSSAVLMPDGITLKQSQPFQVCAGGYATTRYTVSMHYDIRTGDGIRGAHGGSGLSSIGGTLRVGELMPGSGPIRHALKVNLYASRYLYYDNLTQGYRWPAIRADSYASDSYGGSVPACRMGALLALKPDIDIDTWGLRTEPSKTLAKAFQDYGAYIVDDAAWDVYAIATEQGPAGRFIDEFEEAWGFLFTDSDKTSDWSLDMAQIFSNLHVIDNNSAQSAAGGGSPRAPLAPPFSSSTITTKKQADTRPKPRPELSKTGHMSYYDLRGRTIARIQNACQTHTGIMILQKGKQIRLKAFLIP